jgi:hypothetical protein
MNPFRIMADDGFAWFFDATGSTALILESAVGKRMRGASGVK